MIRLRGPGGILAGLAMLLGGCERPVVAPPSAEITIEAVAGGANQSALVGTAVPIAPAVRVLDARGRPIADARVAFLPLNKRGVTAGALVNTDANGVATVGSWTMDTLAGRHELRAVSDASTSAAEYLFTADATPGTAAALAITPATVSLAPGGTRTLTTDVVDRYGNLVTAGVAPTLVSSDPSVATVNPSGVVSGAAVGVTGIVATFGGFSRTAWTAVGFRPAGVSDSLLGVGRSTYSVALSPANVMFVGSDISVERFDLPGRIATGSLYPMSNVHGIAFSPSGATAYVASFSADRLDIVDVATTTVVRSIGGMSNPTRVLVSPNGAFLYITTFVGDLLRVDTATDAVTTLRLSGRLNGIALSGTQPALYVTNFEGRVFDIDLTGFTLRRSADISGTAQGIAVSLDGTRLFVANTGGALQVLDAATLVRRASIGAVTGAYGVALTRDAAELYVAQPVLGRISVIDPDTYSVVRTITAINPRLITFSASGSFAAILESDPWGGSAVRFVR